MILFLMLFTGASSQLQATFTDGQFYNNDWQVLLYTTGLGGTVTGDHISSGGHFVDYRQVATNLNPAPAGPGKSAVLGIHEKINAIYKPALESAIDSIDFSIDFKSIISSYAGQAFGMSIKQDGNVYGTIQRLTYAVDQWQSEQKVGLKASDFSRFDFTAGEFVMNNIKHPDFSTSGSPIRFGFYTWRSTGASSSSPHSKVIGYDNWSVTVHPVPEPTSLLLLSTTLPMMYRRFKMRSNK